MAVVLENSLNCIWHAFSALQHPETRLVQKSKLKVLTANIGTLLDLYGVERGLDHFRSTSSLNFDHFVYYLQCEVFGSLPSTLTPPEVKSYESRIAEVCWLVCRKLYLNQDSRIFAKDAVYKIFRIFCTLAEIDKKDHAVEVRLHPAEAIWLARTLATSLGTPWDDEDWRQLTDAGGPMKLGVFVTLLEAKCISDFHDIVPVTEAVNDMYLTLIEDVIKKGYLMKKGFLLPTFREYWFVLRPYELKYYKTRFEKDCSGTLALDPACRIEVNDSGYKFALQSSSGSYELSAHDQMSRRQWVAALRLAAQYSGNAGGYQKALAVKRKQQRERRAEMEQTRELQLAEERAAREAAEGRAGILEIIAKDEAKRAAELEEVRTTLEHLLEEETQAKRDEETVRALQARVLAEEWEHREELEKIQNEQKAMLEYERSTRCVLEVRQREAERLLQKLEDERKSLDRQLKAAHARIQRSEESREVLEARLRAVSPLTRDGDKVRRTQSFMPSSRERPVMLEVRASTLRRASKQ